MLDRVERLARERDSGRDVGEAVNNLEWELLLIRDEAIEIYERNLRVRVAEALEAVIGLQKLAR